MHPLCKGGCISTSRHVFSKNLFSYNLFLTLYFCTMTVESKNMILTVILGIVIIILGWWLYHSIVDPYEIVEERQRVTEQVRHNMEDIRDGLIQYDRRKDSFPPTQGGLDSLLAFMKTDSLMNAQMDSLFKDDPKSGYTFKLDSLIYTPRAPHKRFKYTLNDTINPQIYLLEDPDTSYTDKIGSLEKTTLLNAPSWK